MKHSPHFLSSVSNSILLLQYLILTHIINNLGEDLPLQDANSTSSNFLKYRRKTLANTPSKPIFKDPSKSKKSPRIWIKHPKQFPSPKKHLRPKTRTETLTEYEAKRRKSGQIVHQVDNKSSSPSSSRTLNYKYLASLRHIQRNPTLAFDTDRKSYIYLDTYLQDQQNLEKLKGFSKLRSRNTSRSESYESLNRRMSAGMTLKSFSYRSLTRGAL